MIVIVLGTLSINAQDVKYSESFTNGASYCPGDPQYDNWGVFRSQLDSTTKKFLKVTVKGTQNPTGITCNDPTITRRIAEALRTNSNLSVVCNGQTWLVTSNNCQSTNCGNAVDDVELVVTTAFACQCTNPSYIFRPCIGNLNWGGLNGTTCSAPTQTMEIIFSNPVGNNAAPGGVTAPVTSCGSANDSISVSIRNAGINRIANIPVTCNVTGTLGGSPYNQTFNTTIGVGTDSLEPFTSRLHTFTTINTTAGADLDIELYTALSSDTTQRDDTLRIKFKNVGTPAGNATANDVTICGTGAAPLSATVPSGHSAYWYNSKGDLVAVGASANSPIVPGGAQDSVFVASALVGSQTTLGSDFNGSSSANTGFTAGNMINLNVKKHLTIEEINVHLRTTNANKITVYKKAGKYDGFQNNKASWTFVGEYDVIGGGLNKATNVKVDPIELTPGAWSLYIYAADGMVWNGTGSNPQLSEDDFDLGLSGAIAMRDAFANQLGNLVEWNGEIIYRQTCVSSNKSKVTITANPLPVGSFMKEGALFKGTYDGGTDVQPDIVASPDSICYDIPAPTNFANSGYGSSSNWFVNNVSVTTSGGAVVPTSEYKLTAPSGSDDAKICFYPTSTFTDSTVEIVVNVRRLDNGCDSVLRRTIFVAPRPVSMYTNTTVCLGEVTEFSNSSTISTGKIESYWEFGDGTTSTLTDPAKVYNAAGNYTVKLYSISDKGYRDSSIQTITVKEIPDPNFTTINACEGTALSFTSTSSLPVGTPTYVWDFGDGATVNTGATNTTSHLYSTPDIYPVKLLVEVNGCANSITKYATQAPRSTPDFSFANAKCDDLNITFSNGTTLPAFGTVGYTWRFGDGKEAAEPSPIHTYNVFNSFDVTLIGSTDLGCKDSITKTVTLLESPKPVFTANGSVCTNEEITFNNTTNVPTGFSNSYEWDFGNGNASTASDPTTRYSTPGTYEVTVKAVSSNGCDGETKGTVTISEKPIADFVANKVCEGDETKFTNGSVISSGTLSHTWDLDNGGASVSTTNPTFTYASANTYNVTLISESGAGCSDTATKQVVVAAIPAIDINIASNQTQDGTMLFSTSSTGTGYTYSWLFGDGGSAKQQNPTYKFDFPGNWKVTLVIRNADGCENTMSTQVYINPLSVGNIAGNNWSIYPNPSSGKYFINYDGGADIATIKISDILGKVVTTIAPDMTVNNELTFDLSNQKAGVYVITLTDVNGNSSTQKVTLSK